MIGKYLTNLRQLKKVGDLVSHQVLIQTQNSDIIDGVAICGEKSYYVLNRYIANVSSLNSKVSNLKKLFDKYNQIISFEGERNLNWVRNSINDIILLPDDFDELFEKFAKANSKQYKEICQKFGIDKTTPPIKYIFCFCNNSMNYFSWAVRNLYSNHVSMYMLIHTLRWAALYPQEISKLSKGTITAYNGKQAIQTLFNEMTVLRSNKRANTAISEFNTQQKHILKTNAFGDATCVNALNKFIRLSDQKRLNFIKKVSTIDNFPEIMHQLSNVCEMHFSWSKESFMEYLNNAMSLDYKLFYDNDNVVIVESKDYETVKRLAKTTNWCISKNKRYWDDYVTSKTNARQFLLFNFNKKEDDELSIVGFTTRLNEGITNAHSFTNANLISGQKMTFVNLKSFANINVSNIYSILNDLNIPISLFDEYSGLKYEWTEENFFNQLKAHVPEENFCVLSSENHKICLLITDTNFHKMFDYKYMRHFDTYIFINHDIFVFCDFTKSKFDTDCMLFSAIEKDDRCDYGTNCFDVTLKSTSMSFDEKLIEYHIPYDIIKRNNDYVTQLINFSNHYDFANLFECLKTDDVKEYIEYHEGVEDIFYSLRESIFTHNSLSFVEQIYSNGYTISQLCGESRTRDLITSLCHEIFRTYGRQTPEEIERIPTEEEYESLFTNACQYHHAKYVAFIHLLTLMVSHESSSVIARLAYVVSDLNYKAVLSPYLLQLIIENYDITTESSVMFRIINFLSVHRLTKELELCVKKFGKDKTFVSMFKEINSTLFETVYKTVN